MKIAKIGRFRDKQAGPRVRIQSAPPSSLRFLAFSRDVLSTPALGHDAIVNFLTNIGLGNDYPRAELSHHIVTSKCIDVEGDKATMTAYWNGLTGPNDEVTPPTTITTVSDGGQYDNTYVKVHGVWKADQNRVVFDSNIVKYPCRN